MKTIYIFCLFIFSSLASSSLLGKPHNVILFLVDDWGWTDGGVFGSDLYETPNIDALAERGVRFTQAYATCTVCSPTRASVMTGLYPARLRVTDWIDGHTPNYTNTPMSEPDWTKKLEHSRVTIAEALREHGYKTASVGKWHLTPIVTPGSEEELAYCPDKHGFDVNIGGNQYGAPGSYFAPFSQRRKVMFNMPEAEEGKHLTECLTDEAIKLIEGWKDEPFFIYFPYYAVHTPIQGIQELVAKYEDKIKPGMLHTNAGYASMVESTDQSIGRILQVLENLDLADETLIILTGDNGGLDPDDSGRITDNFPLRNGKGSVYEGGVRVPCVIYAPDGRAGVVSDTPVISIDYFPTILAALGLSDDRYVTDGEDLMPVVRGEAKSLEERDLFWHYPHYHTQGATPYSAIRSGDYRLIEYHRDGNIELYNLAKDIGEQNELSRELPHIVHQLKTKLRRWLESVDAQMAVPNPKYDPEQATLPPGWARRK